MTQQGHNNGFAGAMVTTAPSLAKAVPYDGTQAFEPRGIEDAMKLAKLLVASRLLPKSVSTPEAAFAIIATGRELGMTAMQSLRSIHVIEGKPTLSADLVAALCKSRGDICKYFMMVSSTATAAAYETLRVGDPKPTTMSFTMEDAQRAGLTGKDNWRKYPAAMLRARCITALARAVYPDLAMGIYDEEELEPMPAPEEHRVWVEAPAQPTVTFDVDETLFSSICQAIDAAETPGHLNIVAHNATKAHKSGRFTDEMFERVKVAGSKKRALLAVPEAPKSEPRQPGEEG